VTYKPDDKRLSSVLSKLGKNNSLYISRPDKGNGTVIMNRSEYIQKMDTILNDSSKFCLIDEDSYRVIQRLESNLNKTLLTLHKLHKLDKPSYDSIRATGSLPGKLYGLPKIHKANVPLRPILSALTCHNYKLSKFLVPLLSPLTLSDFNISDV